MNKADSKKAFSLLELSFVILIIGILIGGITLSSKLVRQFRLSTARTLTQSSPVHGIKDLMLWYDATSEASFKSGGWNDGDLITNDSFGVAWYDLNSQTANKVNAATSTSNVIYSAEAINGLPAVKFPFGTNLVAANFPNFASQDYTLFVVYFSAVLQNGTLLSDRSGLGLKIQFSVINSVPTQAYQICDNPNCYYSSTLVTIANNTNYILSAVYKNGGVVSYYQNGGNAIISPGPGANPTSGTTGAPGPSSGGLYIGSVSAACCLGNYFTGSVGEIIIFDRALKNEERIAVQNYLGKKWRIAVS